MMKRVENLDSIKDGLRFTCFPATARGEASDQGVALVITLLLLFLLSVIGLAAVLSTSSDLLINGYYSNYRGSFYAADSGVNIARQTLQNSLSVSNLTCTTCTCASVGPPAVAAVGPLAGNFGSNIMTNLLTTYASNTALTGSSAANPGAAVNSWGGGFQLVNTASNPTNITLSPGSPTAQCNLVSGTPTPTNYQYIYLYAISSVGTASGSEQSTVTENGSIIVNVNVNSSSTQNVSDAYFGAFITNYPPCLGPLVPGTMTGPMFTDGAWGFMPGGQYIFTDPVGQADSDASYWDSNWNCWQSPNASYTAPNGQTIAPQFQEGFQVGQPPITQPADSFSQMWAAIDGKGQGEADAQPTNADMAANLKAVDGTSYPAGGAATGVFFNYQTVNGVPTIEGGGLMVQGNANILLTPQGNSAQVYTITQGNPAVTTTMTVDPVANTTVVTSGIHTLTLAGVPTNTAVTPAQQGTMIYVNGTITGMSGPGEGMGAIQNGANVTIAAQGDVNLTGDVRYVTEPVTVAANQIPGTPVDTLVPGSNNGQDLGIFTANGNIIMSSPYADDNLEVDGSQAALGGSCAGNSCGFLVNGCINTFNNVGGQLQTNIFGACLNVENTYYDRRYNTVPGFAPPWFPGTTITNNASLAVGQTTVTLQRTSWLSSSGQ